VAMTMMRQAASIELRSAASVVVVPDIGREA
jgi:hypothetical protein